MINTIIFDFGGVIGTDADTVFLVALSRHGIPEVSALEIWEKHWPAMKIGAEHVAALWETVAKYTTSRIADVIRDYESLVGVSKDMLALCRQLKDRGYKLGILANETLEWMDIKRTKGKLNEIFNVVYSSADIGYSKPSPKAYTKILNDLDARPETTLFIDNREQNTEAAAALGVKALVFKNIVQLKKDLSGMGIME